MNTSMKIHYSKQHVPIRLQIPALAFSIHHWDKCKRTKCLPRDSICALHGYVIQAHHCLKSKIQPLKKNSNVSFDVSPVLGFLNNIIDTVNDEFRRQLSDILYFQCQSTQITALLAGASVHISPSQILSYLKGKPTAAITHGDILLETACTTSKMRLLRSLSTEGGIDDKVLPQNLLKSAFITLLSSVTSPAANAFLSFLVIQALFWGIALSLVSA
uniref:Uncharacterized protein LOC108950678 n=1 Tax=Phallusia mammillata TaxID=59560 RepID=A0A6F9DIS4_9ASCI|nr:uncharacterized protein LOC108950678 [Phallusia mammillata]